MAVLESLGFLDWCLLELGWDRGWVTKADLAAYATAKMLTDVTEADLAPIAMLSSPASLGDSDVTHVLKDLSTRYRRHNDSDHAIDKWRLAKLLVLQAQPIDWEEKVTRLEELGVEFGYPPDMRSCSRYVADKQSLTSDPIDAMRNVISQLKQRLESV